VNTIIYKIVPAKLWREAEASGVFGGAGIDLVDGFIHFSTAAQVRRTASLFFAGVEDLLLVGIDESKLGAALVYEKSRDGALFPHLYGTLDLASVTSVTPMPLGADGEHLFPDTIA
jgi:uncharacterized protein (DUF952 family)